MGDAPDAQQHDREQPDDHTAAHESELLPHRREREVGPLDGDVVLRVRHRALQPPLAGDATRGDGPDGIAGLVDVVAQRLVGGVLVEERLDASQLVTVDDARHHRGDHRGHRHQRDQGDVLRLGSCHEQHAHGHRDEHGRRPEVGLHDDQRRRHSHHDQPAEEARIRHLIASFLGQVGGQREQHGRFGELRGLESERPEVEAQPGAAAHRAGDVHEHQHHDRDAVEEPRTLAQRLVVDRHHHHHRDGRGDEEHDLTGDVGERIGLLGPRRRIDDEASDRGERGLDEHQHPVDVATRIARTRADVAEA